MQNTLSCGHYNHIVIHTPHAGTILPIKFCCNPRAHYTGGFQAIEKHFRMLTDHCTDKLFSSILPHISQLSFPYSRLFCDVERLMDDPLEQKGLGICYDIEKYIDTNRHTWHGWTMTKEQAIMLYEQHHYALTYKVNNLSYIPLLLDCHSFSEQPNILNPNAPEYKDIDICLGFNEDYSKPSEATIEFVADFFRKHGYRVAFNEPFSNSMVARNARSHHSLMIEVNKHCYMNEDTLEITDGYYKLHKELQELYKALLSK